jgi:hypothetical protein
MLKRRILMTLAGGGALAALPALAPLAATAASAPSGAIHVYETSTHGPSAPGTIVITGAINDAGVGSATGVAQADGTITLSQGSIKVAPSSTFISREQDFFGRAVHPPGCATSGAFTGPVKIVGGTGAYAHISGIINARDTVAAILPKLKNGTCDTANKVRPVGAVIFISASGSVR